MKAITRMTSPRKAARAPWAMMLPVLILGVFSFFFGERVPAGQGLGWDGVRYAELVSNLPALIDTDALSSYYAQRIGPSSVVRVLIQLTGKPFDTLHIIRAFEVYNLALLLAACWSWNRVLETLQISRRGRWLGFAGIFVTYACSKQAFYYPVLTDVSALFIAVLSLQYYVQRRPLGLLMATLLGAFVWPVMAITGAALILFMEVRPEPGDTVSPAAVTHYGAGSPMIRLSLLGGVFLLSLTAYLWLTKGDVDRSTACQVPDVVSRLLGPGVVPCTVEALLTGAVSVMAAGLALLELAGSMGVMRALVKNFRTVGRLNVLLAVMAVLIPFSIVRWISNAHIENPSSIRYMLEYMLLPPSGKFMLPLVTLSVFWGPMFVLIVLYWKRFCIEVRRLGPGVMVAVALAIPLALANEPRFITVAWPFCVLGMVMALERVQLRQGFAPVFGVLTVLSAQFWLPLNLAPWQPPDHAGLFEFPKQMYFMHYGLWMNWHSYAIQLPMILLGALLLRSQITSFRRVGNTTTKGESAN